MLGAMRLIGSVDCVHACMIGSPGSQAVAYSTATTAAWSAPEVYCVPSLGFVMLPSECDVLDGGPR